MHAPLLFTYDLLPTLWQGEDPAFVEILRLFVEEVEVVRFEVVLIIELFLAEVIVERTVQMVVHRS